MLCIRSLYDKSFFENFCLHLFWVEGYKKTGVIEELNYTGTLKKLTTLKKPPKRG